ENFQVNVEQLSVPASPGSIPLSAIPLQPGAPNADPATAPIKIEELGLSPIKIEELGLAPIKIEELGITPIKIEELGLAAPAVLEGLRHLPLSSIPLIPPQSWEAILSGYSSEPVHNLSLADVLEMSPRPDLSTIEWRDIDLTQPPLGNLSFLSILLGGTKLSAIDGWTDANGDGYVDTRVGASSYWCPRLLALGQASCAASAGGLNATPADLQIAGVPFGGSPSLPIQTFELSGISLAATAPLRSVRVAAFNMDTLIGSISLAGLPAGIVDCGAVDCANGTLRDAGLAGAINDSARFESLLGAAAKLTLGDVAFGLFGEYPVDAIPFDRLAIKGWGGPGSSAVRLTGQIAPVGASSLASDATVSVALPQNFVFDSATPEPSNVTNNKVTWDAAGLAAGDSMSFSLLGRPGLDLGSFPVVATLNENGSTSETRSHSVSVTDTLESHGGFANNNSPASAHPITHGTLNVSFTPAGDTADFFKVQVPPGSGVEVVLGHQTIDRDLIVYSDPASPLATPLRSQKSGAPPQQVLADESIGFDNSEVDLQADAAMDLDLAGLPIAGISQQRGTENEYVRTKALGQTLTIQAAPYFQASSNDPYTLTVRLIPGPQLGECQEPQLGASGVFGVMPPALPADTNTLILFNENRTRRALGDVAAQSIKTQIARLLTDPVLGAGVQLLSVDGDPGVQAADRARDADLCNPELSNNAVRAINAAVDKRLKLSPTDSGPAPESIKHVLIIGDHRVIPAGGVADLTRWGHEGSFAESLAHSYGVGNNSEISAAAHGFIGSDNPYGDVDPTTIPGGYSYRPDWSVGRLVESGDQIASALKRYVDSKGILNPSTAATFGSDFMQDAARQIDAAIETKLGAQLDRADDNWTLSDLAAAVVNSKKDVVSVNAHFDEANALPPGSPGTLFNTSHVAAAPSGVGSIWFTMGCHSGASAPGITDWADTLSGKAVDIFVGQTGYGLGSRAGVSLSEAILVDFSKNLMSGLPAGEALMVAKRNYLDSVGVLGVYEEKALEEATLYGIPMYHIGTPPPAQVSPPAPPADPETGTPAASFTISPKFELQVGADGSKHYTSDGRAHGPQNRPLIPYVPVNVARQGIEARGWTIEAAASNDQSGFKITTSQALLAGSAVAPPSDPFGSVSSPAVPARITPSGKLVFNAGKFSGDPAGGIMRRFTGATVKVYYSNSSDRTAPVFQSADIIKGATSADFVVNVTDNLGPENVKRVTVLYLDETRNWRQGKLTRTSGTEWKLSGTPFTGPGIEAMFFAVDASGNSAVSTSKASNFGGVAPRNLYIFEGFFPPGRSTLNAGQTNPIKFKIFERNKDGSRGKLVTDLKIVSGIWTYPTNCSNGSPTGGAARAEDLTRMRFTDNFFIFNWQSDKAWAGTCQTLQIDLNDGTSPSAYYIFK
ncbi:MAG TPA: PxKF domain-containing protein, partial [Actinomycetota bacterium]|nr:PxKF domain-containing protein [Actinomycetota bacterium]